MSHDDDSDEREERTVELSGIELRALRESAELTALTRSSVAKKKAKPVGLEEGTVPKDIPDADEASTKEGRAEESSGDGKDKDPDTKELPVLVDEPPDPADVSDPTRSIDRSSLKEMIKTEVKQSGAWENKSGIFRKSTLLAEKGKEAASDSSDEAATVPTPTPAEPVSDVLSIDVDVDEDLETDDALFEGLEDMEKEDSAHASETDAAAEDAEDAQREVGEGELIPEADAKKEAIVDDTDDADVEPDPEPAAPSKPSPPSETAEIDVTSPDDTSLTEVDKSRKKLGFGGVVVGLFLALVGGGAALMVPAFQAVGIAAALSGVAITFISALGMRE